MMQCIPSNILTMEGIEMQVIEIMRKVCKIDEIVSMFPNWTVT